MPVIKLYLDEDVDPLLAKVLRDRGYDVITTQDANMFSFQGTPQTDVAVSKQTFR